MKNLVICYLLVWVWVFFGVYSQNYDWSLSVGSSSGESSGQAVASDGFGNVFVAGYYSGTVDFDPLGTTLNRSSQGGQDMYVVKYDLNGVYDKLAIGGNPLGNERANDVVVDASGNVYVTGSYTGSSSFFNPPVFKTSNGGSDIFLIKMANDLSVNWIISMGGTADDEGYGVAVDDSGNIYVTGSFQSASADFDPSAGVNTLSSAGGEDIFIAKYDPAGVLLSVQGMGGTGAERGISIDHDGTSMLYVTGYFEDSVDFDPGAGTDVLASNGGKDAFVAAYSSALSYSWSLSMGGTGEDQGQELRLGVSNDVFVAGFYQGAAVSFGGAVSLSSQGEDGFLVKYSSLGLADWGFTVGGADTDRTLSVALDGCDNIYLSGYFTGTVDFDPSGGTVNRTAAASPQYGYFLGKYNSTGNFLWAGGGGTNPLTSQARGVDVDDAGNVYITGLFSSNGLDADITTGLNILSSYGATSDMFISSHSQSEIIVSNVDDSGSGSLRNAILLANSQAGPDTIRFCIPGSGPFIFSPVTSLPSLTDDSTVIAGTSQPGYYPGILVLDGSLLGGGATGISIINARDCEIWGMTIQNFTDGISLSNADFTIIGGAGKENDINNNSQYGIVISASSQNNLISQNSFYCNSVRGIEIAGAGNGALAAPIITVPDVTGIDGTASPGATIEIYTHGDASCPAAPCQGKTLIGTAIANGAGAWYLPGPFTLGTQITAIAINASNNTSEFAVCQTIDVVLSADAPVLSIQKVGSRYIQLDWRIGLNEHHVKFEVERLNSSGMFEAFAWVEGTQGQSLFRYTDQNPATGENTYRIKQVNPDGSTRYSSAVSLTLAPAVELWTYPNPVRASLHVDFVYELASEKGLRFRLLDRLGRELHLLQSNLPSDHLEIAVDHLPAGIYFLEVSLGERIWEVRKIQLIP